MPDPVPFFDLAAYVGPRRHRILDSVAEVLDGGQFIGGVFVERFEEQFASYVGRRHCVALGNGLDALRIGLEAAGVGSGDEVIVPGFTFYATWLAVLQTGARPVAVDVGEGDAAMDISLVTGAITSRTKAIIPVHLFGIPADMPEIMAIARAHGLFVLEDAAQAHGASVGGRSAGAHGDAAAFSFYPTKNLGALGDAGALVTDDARIAQIARSRRSYGQGNTKYDHVDTGWNSRMDPIQARLLSDELIELDKGNERRHEIAGVYLAALADRDRAAIGPGPHRRSVWHHFVLRSEQRAELRDYLAANGIGTDIHYPYAFDTLAPTRVASEGTIGALPVSEALSASVVSLPIGPWMTDAQVARVAAVLSGVPDHLLSDRHPR
jgi:dTDP-4-amino-4,6-dideoxygalactose transaminase